MSQDQNLNDRKSVGATNTVSVDSYAKKITQQLNANTQNVSGTVASRLNQSRQKALAQYREPARILGLVPAGPLRDLKFSFSQHPLAFGLPLILAVLVAGFGVFNAMQDDGFEDDMFAEAGRVDAAILASDVPINALSDQSFRNVLTSNE